MPRSKLRLLLLAALIGALLLAGCGIQVGWVSKSSKAQMSAKFFYWKGTKQQTISLLADDVVTVAYTADLTKASLSITVTGPHGEICREDFAPGDKSGQFVVTAPKAGDYTVKVAGDRAKGRFSVSWSIAKKYA